MGKLLRVLIVEDSEDDATLLLRVLRREGYEVVHAVVDTPDAMNTALEKQEWDVIISDHAMPCFSAPEALKLAQKLRPDIPFIIVSGEIDINLAVSLMKQGAQDYIQKTELPRLIPAITRELDEAKMRRENKRVREALEISETRYRRLFETAQDGILILDADSGKIDDVNPFLMDMLGYSKDEFVGKNLWEIGLFRDIEASKNVFLKLQSEGYVRYENLPLESKAGRPMAVEFVSNVYLVNNHSVIQCNIRDITKHRQAEEDLKKYHEQLEKLVSERTNKLEATNSELESFSYSASHDLRAPLRNIEGFSQALLEDYSDKLDAQGRDYLKRIMTATRQMMLLIEDLLKLSQITRTEMNLEKVNLTRIGRSVINGLQKAQPREQVEVKIAEGLEDTADSRLIRIVLENLLGNSWKFTEKKANAVIEFGATAEGGKKTYFVRDNGAGFDMAFADKLFAPFQRLHAVEEYAGTGIGLATVRRIIHRHGGKVWAEGQKGKGATLYFSLQKQ